MKSKINLIINLVWLLLACNSCVKLLNSNLVFPMRTRQTSISKVVNSVHAHV